ncbi:MAG: transposase [Actinobacteria bacterium]|nr:transposase [Actinomycetota bacterium]
MEELTACDDIDVVPPPRRQGKARTLGIHAVQLITMLGLLPLAAGILAFALLCRPRLPSGKRRRGRPIVYSDASIVVIVLITRFWNLSDREVYDWLVSWSAMATACGLPRSRVIHYAHLNRRVRALGAFPFWLLYLALVWRAIRSGLLRGRDVVIDSTLLSAWTGTDPDGAWSFPSEWKGRVFGYKIHTLLDRLARLPLFFLLSPANATALPFAYTLLWFARFVLALPIHVVRADGAYWGSELVRFIVTIIRAHPIIPFNRKKSSLWPRSTTWPTGPSAMLLARSSSGSSPLPNGTIVSIPTTPSVGRLSCSESP